MILSHCPPRHKVVQEGISSLVQDAEPIIINGAIHIYCTILKLAAALAAEAELGALFLNAQEAKVIHLFLLEELVHP